MNDPDRRRFVASIATRYRLRLRRFLAARLRHAQDVPDLAQEVFLRLLRVEDYRSIRSPEAYLLTIASHVIHQHAVRQSATPITVDIADVFDEPQAQSSDDTPERADVESRIEQLQRVLTHLPPRVAATLVMARLGGHSLEEIAEQLGVSRASVKKYLERALEHCREHCVEAG